MLRQEIWHQDPVERDLWVGEHGLLINIAALEERTYYAEVVRVSVQPLQIADYEPAREHAS